MGKIYTRTGDKGTTGLLGGMRVPKDDIRIEANGCLDEVNALVGVVRSQLPASDEWQEVLHAIQRELMVVMSHVATPPGLSNPNVLETDSLTLRLERAMDGLSATLADRAYFVLPGRTPAAAHLQLARAVVRRAERRLWTLHKQTPVDESILRFVNRLSDFFFLLARADMQRQGLSEEKWQAFAYKARR